jgi:uncharacterized protein
VVDVIYGSFCWDEAKEAVNIAKHGVDFRTAAHAFTEPGSKIFADERHGQHEDRYFCIGKVGHRILTVRFVYRDRMVRIYGAGFWRKGRRVYEQTGA